jgi:hypothetical protein
MSLLDTAAQATGVAVKSEAVKATEGVGKGAIYCRERKQKLLAAAEKVVALLTDAQKATVKDEIDLLLRKPGVSAGGIGGKPIIFKLFGENPKVGMKIESIDVYKKTKKGFAEIKALIKRWEKAGTEVKYHGDENGNNDFYTLEKLGKLPTNS